MNCCGGTPLLLGVLLLSMAVPRTPIPPSCLLNSLCLFWPFDCRHLQQEGEEAQEGTEIRRKEGEPGEEQPQPARQGGQQQQAQQAAAARQRQRRQ